MPNIKNNSIVTIRKDKKKKKKVVKIRMLKFLRKVY